VDDGELREFNDPKNVEFLDAVKRGEVPPELQASAAAQEGPLDINLEDHRSEEYKAPAKPRIQAFSGTGHMLSSDYAPAAATTASTTKEEVKIQNTPSNISVDESQPSTQIQIRLADSSRLVQRFNHSHLVSDIRGFIVNQRPDYGSRNFVLMTTFPNKELTNEKLTISEAQLLNSSIVQRLK